MPWYRRKQLSIEAVRWTGSNREELARFAGEAGLADATRIRIEGDVLHIRTLHGWATAAVGDWLARDAVRELYPVAAAVFAASYESSFDEAFQGKV